MAVPPAHMYDKLPVLLLLIAWCLGRWCGDVACCCSQDAVECLALSFCSAMMAERQDHRTAILSCIRLLS